MPNLFSSTTVKGREVKNRIAVPAMVCYQKPSGNCINQEKLEHYERLSKAGNGIIFTEAICVSEFGRLSKNQLGIWNDSFIEGLSKLAQVINKEGALSIAQIHHAGLKTVKESTDLPVAPSDYNEEGFTAREITIEEIDEVKEAFVAAAVRAEKAGFNGIELHGAHGYLISQFLSPITNKRTDEYGQDKAKLGVDIIKAIKAKVSPDFIIGIRFGGNDPSLSQCIDYAKKFEEAGADILSVSFGFTQKKPHDLGYEKNEHYNFLVDLGIKIKPHVNIPVVCVNRIEYPSQAKHIIENDLCDFVALGKAQLTDPEWVVKVKEGRDSEINSCKHCLKCAWFLDETKCPAILHTA